MSASSTDPSEDALKTISEELTAVVDLCKMRGYSVDEIEKTANQFYQDIKASCQKLWLTRVAKTVLFLVVLVMIAQLGPVKRLHSTCSRRILISLVPYWNWIPMFDKRCLYRIM